MTKKLDDDLSRLHLVAPTALVKRIDAWRGRQSDVPSLSEAVRRLIEMSLDATDKKAGKKPSGKQMS